jgi:hypothetical protein
MYFRKIINTLFKTVKSFVFSSKKYNFAALKILGEKKWQRKTKKQEYRLF